MLGTRMLRNKGECSLDWPDEQKYSNIFYISYIQRGMEKNGNIQK